ncbi:hypothetical protein PR048_025481 [Dryococelus australis]|uniref:Uncharacterized protein n=1 Tax=Dryococelus australis TaxID=614101 RepID=A0ABQ9GRD6_9NEOP|nr:hypothetical protein PR048_025481 [Dryococelus australis]
MLLARYQNKRLIMSHHIDAVLEAYTAYVENPTSVWQFPSVITENISVLRALEFPVDQIVHHPSCVVCVMPNITQFYILQNVNKVPLNLTTIMKKVQQEMWKGHSLLTATTVIHNLSGASMLLSSAKVAIKNSSSEYETVQALLSTASEANFIFEECVQYLGLKHRKTQLTMMHPIFN